MTWFEDLFAFLLLGSAIVCTWRHRSIGLAATVYLLIGFMITMLLVYEPLRSAAMANVAMDGFGAILTAAWWRMTRERWLVWLSATFLMATLGHVAYYAGAISDFCYLALLNGLGLAQGVIVIWGNIDATDHRRRRVRGRPGSGWRAAWIAVRQAWPIH